MRVDARFVIGQATGLLMADLRVGAVQAFDLLRRAGAREGGSLLTVAQQVVMAAEACDVRPGEVVGAHAPSR